MFYHEYYAAGWNAALDGKKLIDNPSKYIEEIKSPYDEWNNGFFINWQQGWLDFNSYKTIPLLGKIEGNNVSFNFKKDIS